MIFGLTLVSWCDFGIYTKFTSPKLKISFFVYGCSQPSDIRHPFAVNRPDSSDTTVLDFIDLKAMLIIALIFIRWSGFCHCTRSNRRRGGEVSPAPARQSE